MLITNFLSYLFENFVKFENKQENKKLDNNFQISL